MITKTFKIVLASKTKREMQKDIDYLERTFGAEEVEVGDFVKMLAMDKMARYIKTEMDELLKSPWAQDKTLAPHDMVVKEAFSMVKDLIVNKFEVKEDSE